MRNLIRLDPKLTLALVAVGVTCFLLLLLLRPTFSRGQLVGCWDWESGAVPENAGMFRYWTFAEHGGWDLSDGVCYYSAGAWALDGDELRLMESAEFSADRREFEYSVRLEDSGRLLMISPSGQQTIWRRHEQPLEPVLRR